MENSSKSDGTSATSWIVLPESVIRPISSLHRSIYRLFCSTLLAPMFFALDACCAAFVAEIETK